MKQQHFQTKSFFYSLLGYLFFALLPSTSLAQPGTIDTTFNPTDIGFGNGEGATNQVSSTVIQTNGRIIICGSFSSYNGTARNSIVRLNADGTLDTTFIATGTAANQSIADVALQSDGKIIVVGSFTTINGTSRNNIARLNTDGSIDTTFNIAGTNFPISTVTIHLGQIIIGGSFTTVNGTPRNCIARLNSNGSIDTTFNIGFGASHSVLTIAVQSNGQILIGGQFTSFNAVGRNYMARLNQNGSLDTTFIPGSGANNIVRRIAIQSNGSILVGGDFTTFSSVSSPRMVRLLSNGNVDTSFSTGSGFNGQIFSIVIQSDGKVLVGGEFASYNGSPQVRLARLNANGTLDATFNSGIGANQVIVDAAIQSDGKIVVVGNFFQYNAIVKRGVARVNADGSMDPNFNKGSGVNGAVRASAIQNDGKVIIGGDFTVVNGTLINRLARLNPDGSMDTSFNGITTGFNNTIYAIAIQSDGKIIVGGNFTTYNGQTRNRIVRLEANGIVDHSFNVGTGADFVVRTIVIQNDGKILVGGGFSSFNGTTRNRILRLNTDGSIDTTFNTSVGADSNVNDIVLQNDGKVIIAGFFTLYNGVPRNRIARLNANGSYDTSFDIGSGFNNQVSTLAMQSDGKLVVAGSFSSYNGVATSGMVRLNANGTLDTSFNTGSGPNNTVNDIAIQADGKLIIGGLFLIFNGTPTNYITRLNTNGTIDTSFASGTGTNYYVNTLSIQNNGKVIIGGEFISYNGTGRNRLARLNTQTAQITAFTPSNGCANITPVVITGTGFTGATAVSFGGTAAASFTIDSPTQITAIPANGSSGIITIFLPTETITSGSLFTVNSVTTNTRNVTICEGESYTWGTHFGDETYTTAGTYSYIYNCQLEILNLTVVPYTVNVTEVTACDSYTWPINGQTYTTSGTRDYWFGCHTDRLVLTITPSTSNTTVVNTCNSYTWPVNNQTYTTSGTYTNVVNCHTEIVHLTITPSTTNTSTIVVCDQYTWPVNGTTYNTSGTYTYVVDCLAEVLHLTIAPSTSNTSTIVVCDQYTWPVNGTTYNTSGTYTSVVDCQVEVLDLTITPSTSNTTTVVACDLYTWSVNNTTYNTSGTYTNVVDCHTEVLNLTIQNSMTYYADTDNDGFGNPLVASTTCEAPIQYVTNNFDCNDNNAMVNPNATEVCYDGIDNNCDGVIDEGCTPINSVLQTTQCGSTLTTINQNIFANLVSGAQGYRFRVTDMSTNQVQTIDRALRVFQLTQLGNYAFNRTYQIEVSVRYANVWQPFYGLPCTVTTPVVTTQVQTAQCGITLTNMNDIIYANNVPFAAGYKFRITNLITSAQQEIERPVRDIRIALSAIAEFNSTYTIEVAVKNSNGTYLPYGNPCSITTPSFPTTQLQITQCDVVIANANTFIFAYSFTGASTYRFRFSSGTFSYTFDRPTRSFSLNTVPGLTPATTYSVQVALEINGIFGPYGKVCTLTTPGTARLEMPKENVFEVSTYPNPFSASFSVSIQAATDAVLQVKVYDMLGRLMESKTGIPENLSVWELGTDYPSGIYNVIVTHNNEVRSQRVIKR